MALAHQTLDQLPRELLGIIFGNVASKVFFPLRGDAPIIARLLGDPVRAEDLAGLDRFHMLQVLFGQTGLVGPMTVAPLPLARPAANPGAAGQVPATVRQQAVVAQWFQPPKVPADALAVPGPIRDGVRRPAHETPAARHARLTRLYRLLHGAEHDRMVTRILGALDEEILPTYVACRRAHDEQVRAQVLAHPQLVPGKRARLKLLSDLRYGTPACEVRAQVQRVLGQREAAGIDLDADQMTEMGAGRPAGDRPRVILQGSRVAGPDGRAPDLEGLTDVGGPRPRPGPVAAPVGARPAPAQAGSAFVATAPAGAVVWGAALPPDGAPGRDNPFPPGVVDAPGPRAAPPEGAPGAESPANRPPRDAEAAPVLAGDRAALPALAAD